MINRKFLWARRRNEQNTKGHAWRQAFSQATGIPPELVQFIEPESAVERELEFAEYPNLPPIAPSFRRVPALSRDGALEACERYLESYGEELLECHLSHHLEFSFVAPANTFRGRIGALIDFDGDTVLLCKGDLSTGIAIDVNREGDTASYEFDTWDKRPE